MENSNVKQIILKNAITDGCISFDMTYHNLNRTQPMSFDSHIHDCYEIYLNISGDLSFAVESKVYPITHGDVIVTKPSEFHHAIINRDCIHEHYCLWLSTNNNLSHILSFLSDKQNGECNLISMPMDKKEVLIEHFKSLKDTKDNLCDINNLSALFSILNLLSKYHTNTVSAIKFPEKFSEITNYIDNNYNEKCAVAELAERFFISRSTLTRQFKKYLDISPSKYVEARRLSAAKILLGQGESVQSVCIKCGFTDYSHFISLFRKKFGVTPYRYSKAYKMAYLTE